MKALIRTGLEPKQFSYKEVPVPRINEKQALVRVKAVGVCGTDYHMWTGSIVTDTPIIVGHEFCGIVEKVGEKVKNVEKGDKVVSRLNIGTCGICLACLSGNPQMCIHRKCPGFQINGAYAEYIAIEGKQLMKISDDVPFTSGALAEPTAIVTHALLERTKIEAEDTVVVFGPGPIGLLAIQLSVLYGASQVVVVGTNVDENVRLPLAKKMGANITVNAQKEDVAKKIMEFTGGKGTDIVIEASGAEAAINAGISVLRRQGRMCVIGIPTTKRNTICWENAVQKSLEVIFTYSSSPTSWNKVVSMYNRGAIDVTDLITHTCSLKEYSELFTEIGKGNVIKGLFLP